MLQTIAADLEGKTTYRRPALREDAPLITDCLTSINYVFKKALGLDIPLTFIGDMPRRLLSYSEWRLLKIDAKDMQCGDLLFVKKKKNVKLLSHVALVVASDRIFHCCQSLGTAVVQSTEDFFCLYEQQLNFRKMVRYVDPRNKKLREEQKSGFWV